MSIAVHRAVLEPVRAWRRDPADYKAYADWFDNHDAQTYEQILDSPLTLMGSPDRIIDKMGTIVDMGWQNLMLRMSSRAGDGSQPCARLDGAFSREVMPAVAELESAKVDGHVDCHPHQYGARTRARGGCDRVRRSLVFVGPTSLKSRPASPRPSRVRRRARRPIGLLLRNDPAMIGAVLGTLLAGGCVVTINPHQGDEPLAAEIQRLAVPCSSAARATGADQVSQTRPVHSAAPASRSR